MSMKNSIDTIGNRTRDLPACSTVPQETAPPRNPSFRYCDHISYPSRYPRYVNVLLMNILFDWLVLWSGFLLEKRIISQLVKKLPPFYETWMFISAFTITTCTHPEPFQSSPHSYPVSTSKIQFNIKLFINAYLFRVSFSLKILTTKTLINMSITAVF
jgi:hypothetical protein